MTRKKLVKPCPDCSSKSKQNSGGVYQCPKRTCSVTQFNIDRWGNYTRIKRAVMV